MIRTLPIAALLLCAAACSAPWTVRPIEETKPQAVSAGALWESKILPAILVSAVDARVLLDSADPQAQFGHRQDNGPVYFIVKGSGRVTSVDTHSRVGIAFVDIAPFDGKPDVSIQIGPVLRGSSLRDATGLVHFSDFVNQLQYADAANELNDHVLKNVLARIDAATLKGRSVTFSGTVAAEAKSDPKIEPALRELVPAQLIVGENR
ncbi:putative Periplasmic lipoprotein [Candidatus Sulfopaludibacter sp. SbA3]|nr:putative Periplasmic lipoprotein [Candidatus Sulfopaludibacter sp. SbA3]